LDAVPKVRTPEGRFDSRVVTRELNRAHVVFSTCAGAGSTLLSLSTHPFKMVVLDEASQVWLGVPELTRVCQNHIYTVYIRYFLQGFRQTYGRSYTAYMCTVLANARCDGIV
jgi:hypothetical protein